MGNITLADANLNVHLINPVHTIRKINKDSAMFPLSSQQLFTVMISVAIVAGFACQWIMTF
jgi:hypothetical protein